MLKTKGVQGEKILGALAAGAKDDAIRMAHTLKGVSGNIGATALHKQARVVETMIRRDDVNLSAAITGMTEALERICREITSVLEEQSKETDTKDNTLFDKEAVVPKLKDLSRYLLASDTRANNVTKEILAMVDGTPLKNRYGSD